MTDTTRRLSAEMREKRRRQLVGFATTRGVSTHEGCELDALHDLDVADREIAAAQATIAQQRQEVQRAICDTESVARSSNDNIIFLRDEIRKKDILLAERTEDALVLAEKLKFAEMDLYAKGQYVEEAEQRIKDQAQRLTQQGAVIAAMREVLSFISVIRFEGETLNTCACCGGKGESIIAHIPTCVMANKEYAQLAADHNAAIREPLEAQIATQEDALNDLLDGLEANSDERAGLSQEQWERRIRAAKSVALHLADQSATFVARIKTEARADERRKVLEEVKETLESVIAILTYKAADILRLRSYQDDDATDEKLRRIAVSLSDSGRDKLRGLLEQLAAQPEEAGNG